MTKRTRRAALLSVVLAVGMCGCGLIHGDPNDFERGSGGVGVLQPQLQPPADSSRSPRPVMPTNGEGL